MPQKYEKGQERGIMGNDMSCNGMGCMNHETSEGKEMWETNSRNNGNGQPDMIKNFNYVDGNERSVVVMPLTSIEHQNPGMRQVGGVHPADVYGTPNYNTNGQSIFGR